MTQDIRFRFAVDGAPEAANAFKTVGQAAAQVGSTTTTHGIASAARSVDALGISARQTAAAMRVLPAQLTDIATQLAGGQSPFLVLLQQGGQIKDSFGGIGAAGRALLAVLTPTNLALGAAAATLGTLTYAAIRGESELRAYRQALVLTGNAAGTTAAALQQSATSVGRMVHSQGDATAALAALAATGRVAGKDLELLAEAALRLQREGGPAVADTVRMFAELGKNPTKAAAALNESTRFLTGSLYEQIKALELQGRTAEAASLAQTSYAKVAIERTKELETQLGNVEQAWRAVKNVASDAKDAILGWGRPSTDVTALENARKQLEALRAERAAIADGDRGVRGQFLDAEIKRVEAYASKLETATDATREFARAQNALADSSAASTAFSDLADKFKTAGQLWSEQVASLRTLGARAGVEAGKIEALVGRMYALSAAGQQAVALAQASINASAAIAAQQSARTLQDIQDRVRLGYQTELSSLYDIADANTLAANAEVARLSAIINSTPRIAENSATLKSLYGQLEVAAAKSAAVQAKGANDIAAAYKRIADATAALRTQQLAEDFDAEAQFVVAYGKKLEAVNLSIHRYGVELEDAAYAHEQELRASALDDRQRQIRLKQLQIELETRRRIREVEAQHLSGDDQAEKIDAIRRQGAEASAQVAQQVTQTFETKVYYGIRDTLTDAILDGGASGARRLEDLFKRLVLRPIVQAGVTSLLGSLGIGASGLQQAAGIGNVVGGAGGLLSLGSAVSGGLTGLATSGIGQSLGLSSAFEIGGGSGISMVLPSSGISSGISAISSVAPYLAAAMAIYQIAKGLDSSGTPHFGGYAAFDAMGKLVPGYGAGESNRSADYDRLVGNLIRPVGTALNSLAGALGLGGGFGVAGTFKAQADGKDGAWGIVQIDRAGGQSVFRRADGTLAGDPTKGFEEYTQLLGSSVREALEQLDLPGWADELLGKLDASAATEQIIGAVDQIAQTATALDGLSDSFQSMGGLFEQVAGSGQDVQYQLASLFGGVDSLAQQAAAYYESFYTDAEKAARSTRLVAAALGDVGLAVPESRDAFRALVDAQDASTAAGRENIRALLGVSTVFADLHPLAEQLGNDLARQADVLRERQGLETELLRLQGDTTALRERELAGLDESNRALQLQIYGLQDAAEAARELAEQQAQATRELAEQQAQATRLAASAIDEIARAAQRLDAARSGVTTALQALAGYRQGLTDELARLVGDIAAVRASALEGVDTARDRLARAVDSIAAAMGAAADRVAQAQQQIDSARGQRAGSATSIAQLLEQQRGSLRAALQGLSGSADEASAAEQAARGRITDAYLAAQADATRAQERLAGLQARAADSTDNLARVMGTLSDSISDYLLELTGQTAPLARQPAVTRNAFLDLAARAQAGDRQAAQQLVGSARTFLDASRSGSSTGAAYDADVRLVRQVLARVGGVASASSAVATVDSSAEAIAQASADLSTALAEVERLRSVAELAGASLTANAVDLLGEWRLAQAAATTAQQAYLDAAARAAAVGVAEDGAASEFDAALQAITGSLSRAAAAGVDLSLADTRDALQGLIDSYTEADAAIDTATQTYSTALADQARATDLYASAQSIAAQAGLSLGGTLTGLDALFGDLGAAARQLTDAQRLAAEIGAGAAAAPGLSEQYAALTSQAAALNASLAEFDRRVTDVDFSGLQVLDPLGDLLQTYADAVNELIGATTAQQALARTGQWEDLGGGFWRYRSSGGAVAVQQGSNEPIVAGIDGRTFGLGAIQEFVRQRMAAGDLERIYREAVALGISSDDLERITGSGKVVLDWARAQGLPAFAGGTAYVPSTGLALVHEGERILPAPDNALLMQMLSEPRDDVAAEVRALRAEVARLREEQLAGHAGIAEGTRETARQLRRWDGDGVPVVNLAGSTLDTTP